MEIVILLAGAVALFFGVRAFLRGQAQKMNTQLQASVTPEVARQAALALTDEQHREVYRAIAAENGQQALAVFREATGFSMKGSIIAVQALHQFPQSPPSQIQFEQGFNLNADSEDAAERPERPQRNDDDSGAPSSAAENTKSSERADSADAIEGDPSRESAEQDLPANPADLPDPLADVPTPGTESSHAESQRSGSPNPGAERDPQAEAQADELLKRSGFNPDEELVIPEDWAHQSHEQAGFHLEVQRGEEKIVLSHEDLEPWVHDQLYALLRDDHVDEAARLLAEHSPLTPDEAHRFLLAFKNQG